MKQKDQLPEVSPIVLRHTSVLIVFIALCASPIAHGQQRFHQTHEAMGTIFELDIYAQDEATASRIAEEAFETIDRLDNELSNYKTTSELSRISQNAGHVAVTTDPETFAFLQRSLYWSRASGGAFDITVGPLLRAWGFFFHNGRIPSNTELAELKKYIGWHKVILNARLRSVQFSNGKPIELDPGSIGKGFAVDRVVAQLRVEGVRAAFLSAGGSTLYGIGAPPGEMGWPVVVPDPLHPDAAGTVVMLRDESLSTGACTEKFFIRDGHRYCHIFNPHTMRPVEGMLQTTVIDPSATDSDALSTVAFVLSPEQSKQFFAGRSATRVLLYSQPDASKGCFAIHWEGDVCGNKTALQKDQKQ